MFWEASISRKGGTVVCSQQQWVRKPLPTPLSACVSVRRCYLRALVVCIALWRRMLNTCRCRSPSVLLWRTTCLLMSFAHLLVGRDFLRGMVFKCFSSLKTTLGVLQIRFWFSAAFYCMRFTTWPAWAHTASQVGRNQILCVCIAKEEGWIDLKPTWE